MFCLFGISAAANVADMAAKAPPPFGWTGFHTGGEVEGLNPIV